MLRLSLACAVCVLVACATPRGARTELPRPDARGPVSALGPTAPAQVPVAEAPVAEALPPPEPALGERLAATASRWVGVRSVRKLSRKVTDDCSGLIKLAYLRTGVELDLGDSFVGGSAAKQMHLDARRRGVLREEAPRVGDLVFFFNTYDRNRDGKRNDGVTHVGIVEKIDEDGTVTFIHRGGKGVARSRMNLAQPSARTSADGKVLNDYVRRPDRSRAKRLAGQLFAGFAPPETFVATEPLPVAAQP